MNVIGGDFPSGNCRVSRGLIRYPNGDDIYIGPSWVYSLNVSSDAKVADPAGFLRGGIAGGVLLGGKGWLAGSILANKPQDGVIVRIVFRDGRTLIGTTSFQEYQSLVSSAGADALSTVPPETNQESQERFAAATRSYIEPHSFIHTFEKKTIGFLKYTRAMKFEVNSEGVEFHLPNMSLEEAARSKNLHNSMPLTKVPLDEVLSISSIKMANGEDGLRLETITSTLDFPANAMNAKKSIETLESARSSSAQIALEASAAEQATSGAKASDTVSGNSVAEAIVQLGILKDKGLISEQEFQDKKLQLLERL